MVDYKMEEPVGREHLDRLSELPQSLILHILSYLPMRDVVSTKLLSKRWENLWRMIPCLNFTHIISQNDEPNSHRLRNFVNRALILWKGVKLLKFTIDIDFYFEESLISDMNLWVQFAVENKVEELNISLSYNRPLVMMREVAVMYNKKDVYRAPRCLNSCSSIRKLSLYGCNLQIHGSPAWTQLKSLKIKGFFFSENLINRILLGSPQLEEFELWFLESNENLNVRSTSLKRLKINKHFHFRGEDPYLDTVLRIRCPNLETLEISGFFYTKCLFTNFSSLTDATLGFHGSEHYDTRGIKMLGESMAHMFSTFQLVERVELSSCCFEVIRASQKKNLFSQLSSVVFLEVRVYSFELIEMVNLLEIFPNLKMLVIIDYCSKHSPDINEEACLEFETNLCKSFLLQLKIVQILSCFSQSSIFRCIELLLKHGSMLEKLIIWTKCMLPHSQTKFLEVAETVLSMPRSSPTAKVIFNNK